MEVAYLFSNFIDLDREFTSWSDDDDSSSVLLLELETVEELEAGNEVG
jgi:hypothetical protein